MLIQGFYTVSRFQDNQDNIDAIVALNPDHDVYRGHFPGQPVVPGVVQLQIIKELLEQAQGVRLNMSGMSSAKFLNPIDPRKSPTLMISIDYRNDETGLKTDTVIAEAGQVFTKIRASFTPA